MLVVVVVLDAPPAPAAAPCGCRRAVQRPPPEARGRQLNTEELAAAVRELRQRVFGLREDEAGASTARTVCGLSGCHGQDTGLEAG